MGASFQTLYKKLNSRQKEAVDAIEGPVMVIAGPGTGKTQILTLRIANILKQTDTSADSVLALTFTESGVFSMRKRLVEIIGSSGYSVNIYTFHGFCNDVIKKNPDSFPRIIGAKNINDIDKISLLKEIVLNSPIKHLRPFGDNFYYVNPLRSKISELKREGISPDGLKKIIKSQRGDYVKIEDLFHEKGKYKGKIKGKYSDLEKKIEKNEELLVVFMEYEKLLSERRLYDYEDMILETIKALGEDSDLLLRLQEEFQYILADEHQDANNAQNKLLELLAGFHEQPNLFIVGDEKQAIFRFQGASLDNFLYFKKMYPKATPITLENNYRSTQSILDGAHSLITKGIVDDKNKNMRIPLMAAAAGAQKPIEIHSFSKPDFEYLYLASDIQEKIDMGVPPAEIAILYRNNRDADAIIRILEKTKIPFAIESDQSVLNDIDIQKLLIILNVVNKYGENSRLVPLLHIDFFGLDNLDIYKLHTHAKRNRIKLFSILGSKTELKKAGIKNISSFYNINKLLSYLNTRAYNSTLLDFFDIVVNESGFLTHILESEHSIEKLSKLNGLFGDLRTLVEHHREYTLSDLMIYFDALVEHNINIKRESKGILPKCIRLMTAHKSKGLEFDYVYITDVHDGHWGNKKRVEHFAVPLSGIQIQDFDKIDDERRLFYVAITRARLGVSVLLTREGEAGKPRLPSQFIEEIDNKLKISYSMDKFESSTPLSTLLLPSNKVAVPPTKDKLFLNKLFLEQGLSVTALNNFLKCPWSYFYSSLLRVPRSQNKHLMFGNAIHATLQNYFDKFKEGEDIGIIKLQELFEDNLNKQPLDEHVYSEILAKGTEALSGYHKAYIKSWESNILNEFKINILYPVSLPEVNDLRLRGNVDKIEILEGGKVNVVDYKTGKPKTRNFIEGNTKNSNGDYKRQLVFYKLLLDHYGERKFEVITGDIDFVEPDSNGKYKKEGFLIEGEDVSRLKKEIVRVAKSILDLSFWDERCEDKKCEYCALRERMEG